MNIDDLKHVNVAFDNILIPRLLWYSATKYCYLQRNSDFDNTWIKEKDSNPYVWFLCKKMLGLKCFKIFKTCDSCDTHAKSEPQILEDTIGIYLKDAKPLFFELCDKLRNSIAHGTFNMSGNIIFGIGQSHSKKESPINLYYNFSLGSGKVLNDLFDLVKRLSAMTPRDLYTFALEFLGAKSISDNVFIYKGRSYVFNDATFKVTKENIECFEKGKIKDTIYVFSNVQWMTTSKDKIDKIKNSIQLIETTDFIESIAGDSMYESSENSRMVGDDHKRW